MFSFMSKDKLDPTRPISIPFFAHPLFKVHYAAQNKVEKNLLFATWGGIGDVICSEPTIRYATRHFKGCKIAVATHIPEIFDHLKEIVDIYDLRKERPVEDDWLILHTIPRQDQSNMTGLFLSHMATNCLDFPALSALHAQLPVNERHVKLLPKLPTDEQVLNIAANPGVHVAVHAGRHWQSKTFRASWWNDVLKSIKKSGFTPVLLGKDAGESQGYVDVDAEGCVDLRDKTSINDSIWLLKHMPVLVCNDSSPLHMAAAGNAWILYIASVKHPDFITHWRQPAPFQSNVWSWRMKNLSVGGLWDHFDIAPNRTEDVNLDNVPQELIDGLLPDPTTIGPLCKDKMNDYFSKI